MKKLDLNYSTDAAFNHFAPELAKKSPEAFKAFQDEAKIQEWRMKALNFNVLSEQLTRYERALNIAKAHLDRKIRKEIDEILEGK